MSHELTVVLERVRYKLLRAFKAMASEGAISQEQFREVAHLIERIEHVPADEVRRVMEGLSHAAVRACSADAPGCGQPSGEMGASQPQGPEAVVGAQATGDVAERAAA